MTRILYASAHGDSVMSIRAARWILWLTLVLILPLPFFLAETGLAPPARILMLGLVSLVVMMVEGPSGVVRLAATLLIAQAAAYAGVLWLIAAVAARALGRLAPVTLRRVTLSAVVAAVVGAAMFALYRDPFRADVLYTTLLHVYE